MKLAADMRQIAAQAELLLSAAQRAKIKAAAAQLERYEKAMVLLNECRECCPECGDRCGYTVYPGMPDGQPVQQQCQWCDEADGLLKAWGGDR